MFIFCFPVIQLLISITTSMRVSSLSTLSSNDSYFRRDTAHHKMRNTFMKVIEDHRANNITDKKDMLHPTPKLIAIFISPSDLAVPIRGGKVLTQTDEFFAAANNLLSPTTPISCPGKFVATGTRYDDRETRRHNAHYDFVVIKLGYSGTITGFEIDTAYFAGNHDPILHLVKEFRDKDHETKSSSKSPRQQQRQGPMKNALLSRGDPSSPPSSKRTL
jgi:hypothetical protein